MTRANAPTTAPTNAPTTAPMPALRIPASANPMLAPSTAPNTAPNMASPRLACFSKFLTLEYQTDGTARQFSPLSRDWYTE